MRRSDKKKTAVKRHLKIFSPTRKGEHSDEEPLNKERTMRRHSKQHSERIYHREMEDLEAGQPGCLVENDSQFAQLQFFYERSKLHQQGQQIFTIKYITYFSSLSLSTAILVAIYAIRGYSDSVACETQSGVSVTEKMMNTFRVCFVTHFAQFFNCAFLGPILQVLMQTKMAATSSSEHKITEGLATASVALEVILHLLVLALIIWQLFLLNREDNLACFNSQEHLQEESKWMKYAVILQSVYLIFFTIYRMQLRTLTSYTDELIAQQYASGGKIARNNLNQSLRTALEEKLIGTSSPYLSKESSSFQRLAASLYVRKGRQRPSRRLGNKNVKQRQSVEQRKSELERYEGKRRMSRIDPPSYRSYMSFSFDQPVDRQTSSSIQKQKESHIDRSKDLSSLSESSNESTPMEEEGYAERTNRIKNGVPQLQSFQRHGIPYLASPPKYSSKRMNRIAWAQKRFNEC